jgi:hypothetical protein
VPLQIVTAGAPGDERYSIFANGHPVGHGELKDLISAEVSKDADPGRPIGPYQGVEGMSGENASGTQPGTPLGEGEIFLGGTAGAAITPQFKDESTTTTSNEQEKTLAAETTVTADKAAAAVTPADVAARHKARLRAFEFRTKTSKSITEAESKSVAEPEDKSTADQENTHP